jgi:hypothetical protein
VKESYLDVFFSDDDAICDRFDDLPLLLKRQIGPTVRQVPRFAESLTPGERPDPKDVEFRLEPRQFVLDLRPAFREWPMSAAKIFLREFSVSTGVQV